MTHTIRRQCVDCHLRKAGSAFRLRSGNYSPVCADCRRDLSEMTDKLRTEWIAKRAKRPPLDSPTPAKQDRWDQRAAKAKDVTIPTGKVYVAGTKRAKPPPFD